MRLRLALAAVLVLLPVVALAGSGTLTIGSVSGLGTNTYTVTMTGSVSGVTVGDDFGCKIADGSGAVYRVLAVDTGTNQLTIADVRTAHSASGYGTPSAGSAWYATPSGGGGDQTKLAVPPYGAVGWGNAMDMNSAVLSARVGVLGRAGAASVSSSTSAYAVARSVAIPAGVFDTDGTMVRITANLRLAAGTGVNMRVSVQTTNSTAVTSEGLHEFYLVREDSNTLAIYNGTSRDTLASPNWHATITASLEIKGGDTAGGSKNDFWVVERLR